METRRRARGCRYDYLPDHGVVSLAQAGDPQACEHLLYKYRGLVRTKVRPYFLMGGEKDDLVQVGMIGLWQSILDYSPAKNISFLSFARICIERHIITAIKTANRLKQTPLNNAVSLDYCLEDSEPEFNLSEVFMTDRDMDPVNCVLRRESDKVLHTSLRNLLSDFEWEVLKRYGIGKSYREIAQDLECNSKSVDNALGRIKRKVSTTEAPLFT